MEEISFTHWTSTTESSQKEILKCLQQTTRMRGQNDPQEQLNEMINLRADVWGEELTALSAALGGK